MVLNVCQNVIQEKQTNKQTHMLVETAIIVKLMQIIATTSFANLCSTSSLSLQLLCIMNLMVLYLIRAGSFLSLFSLSQIFFLSYFVKPFGIPLVF